MNNFRLITFLDWSNFDKNIFNEIMMKLNLTCFFIRFAT